MRIVSPISCFYTCSVGECDLLQCKLSITKCWISCLLLSYQSGLLTPMLTSVHLWSFPLLLYTEFYSHSMLLWSLQFRCTCTQVNLIYVYPAGSLVRSGRKTLAPEENIKTDWSIPKSAARGRDLDSNNLKHASRNLRTNFRNEGPSSRSHNVSQSSNSRTAAPSGEKADAASKKKFKKYLCYLCFFM